MFKAFIRLIPAFIEIDWHSWRCFHRKFPEEGTLAEWAESALRSFVSHSFANVWSYVFIACRRGWPDMLHTLLESHVLLPSTGELVPTFENLKLGKHHQGCIETALNNAKSHPPGVTRDVITSLLRHMAQGSHHKPSHIQYTLCKVAVTHCARHDDVHMLHDIMQLANHHPQYPALKMPLTRDNNAIIRAALKAGSTRVVEYLLNLPSSAGVDAWALHGNGITRAVQQGHADALRSVLRRMVPARARGGAQLSQVTSSGAAAAAPTVTITWRFWRRKSLYPVILGHGTDNACVREMCALPAAFLDDGLDFPRAAAELAKSDDERRRLRSMHGVSVWGRTVHRVGRGRMVLHRVAARRGAG